MSWLRLLRAIDTRSTTFGHRTFPIRRVALPASALSVWAPRALDRPLHTHGARSSIRLHQLRKCPSVSLRQMTTNQAALVESAERQDKKMADVHAKRPVASSEDDEPLSKKIKSESKPVANGNHADSDDDVPLTAVATNLKKTPAVDSDEEPLSSVAVKKEAKPKKPKVESDDDDMPLGLSIKKEKPKPKPEKKPKGLSDSDDEPLNNMVKGIKKPVPKKKPAVSDSDDEPLANVAKKKSKKEPKKESGKKSVKKEASTPSKKKRAPGEETEAQRRRREAREAELAATRKWWEEDMEFEDGQKWKTLSHKCPQLADPYEPLPKHVKLIYDGKKVDLCPESEEVAGFFAAMVKTDYAQKPQFIKNFFDDWRTQFMSKEEKALITDFKKCDFSSMAKYFEERSEARRNMSKEEKLAIKEEKERQIEEFGWAEVDGFRERVGNFKIEPPGLFRGRGDHPKMGRVKKRVMPEQITINIGEEAPVPEPPAGHKWGSVIHNDKVTWLASWTENISDNIKYIMLNANSRMKGQNDLKKYEKARQLKQCIDKIRAEYNSHLKDKEMMVRQRATALYLIDKLALRVGNEKDTEEEADTVGCCSLRVEHVEVEEPDQVSFDFLGKDSIRYCNTVTVEPQVFKNIKIFMKNKEPQHMIFDRLTVPSLNKFLQEQMEGLTAKVFRTYNASITLQQELAKLTPNLKKANDVEKLAAYNAANRQVAILCNHQRAVPKTHDQSMEKMKAQLKEWKDQLSDLKKERKSKGDDPKLDKKIETLRDRIKKKEVQIADKDDNKTVALGTSKINYMDPRITVAWCRKVGLPIEKVFNKSLRQKFLWAIEMTDEDFVW